jgi:tetraacyldisaccharide 4'-kinase
MKPQRALLPLTPLYRAAVSARDGLYALGVARPRQLAAPVISVGNLSVGGAGKTPLVLCLAHLLTARGYAVDILSRGYGRTSDAVEQVCPEAPRAAARFGDEPTLLATASEVPVFVGRERYRAGLLAERAPSHTRPRVHLLDDGFQHRQLARAADLVLLHRSDFSERLLPAGRLREPFSALRRASFAVLRAEDAPTLEPELRRRGFARPVWRMLREIELPALATGARAVAFCGIAHPGEFFRSLAAAGAQLTATHPFADHHRFADAEIARVAQSARETGARVLLTTEKDLVRLSASQLATLRAAAPLQAVPLRARLLDEEAALSALMAAIAR